jgi:hypothetical protein
MPEKTFQKARQSLSEPRIISLIINRNRSTGQLRHHFGRYRALSDNIFPGFMT